MEKSQTIKRKLKLIKKKGDLYDVISRKKNATPDTFVRKLVKAHTLVFSRILYLFLVCTRRLKNSLAPVEKIKKIQDEIREYVDLPIDIYRTKDIYIKERYKTLGVIYGDYRASLNDKCARPSIEDLESDLKKLADFCENYDINQIFVDEYFLKKYLSTEFLDNFEHVYHSKMLEYETWGEVSYLNIKTSLKGLRNIIAKLEENKFDNEYILSFKDKINDQIIKDAIDTFKNNNDASKLLMVVKSRLGLHINDEGVMKDRVYGKLYESYELGGPYLRVTQMDSAGNLISRNVISLYSYLETSDFSSLEDRVDRLNDNQEIAQIALLYLHLLGEKPKEEYSKEDIYPIYDYIYGEYKKSNKKIPWINSKLQRILAESAQFIVAFYSVVLALLMAFLLKFIPNHLPFGSSFFNKYNSIFDKVESSYGESYEMEKNLIGRLKQFLEKFLPKDMADEILDHAQEEMAVNNKGKVPKKVAEIEWFADDEKPLYFMNQYAERAYFYNGNFEFNLRDGYASYAYLENCEPLFQIKVPMVKSEYEDIDEDSFFHIPLEACPVGDYALTKIVIKDEMDSTKSIVIDEEWYRYNLWDLTDDEKELLKSMEMPMIYYVYGLSSYNPQISFGERDYTQDITEEEAKSAIIEGLGLDEGASDDEINERIATKEYTKYPLYTPTAKTDEIEFYEKIASLDSIDIDLAAVLTTLGNDGFFYTVGYKNANADDYLLTNEAYVWAMNEDGEVIDFLDYFMEEELPNDNGGEKQEQDTYDNWANEAENEKNPSINEKNESENNEVKENETEENETEENEWASEEEKSKIKEMLDKILLWAKEHHVSYYLAAFLAVMIINKMFGRKIQLKLKFRKAYKVLNDANLAQTYADLFEFVYREECMPIERTQEEMIDLLSKQFRTLNEEKINALLDELKSVIKESDNKESLKKVEELLKNIPFIIEKERILKKNYQKKKVLKK